MGKGTLGKRRGELSNTQNADSSTLNSTRQMQVGIPLMQWKQESLDEAFPMGNKETNESWHDGMFPRADEHLRLSLVRHSNAPYK